MDRKLSNILKKCGVPAHILGYEYLGEAIKLVCEDRKYLNKIVKVLYPVVARKFDTTPSRVERAVRFAVEKSFDNMAPETINELFGNTISYYKGYWNDRQMTVTLYPNVSNKFVHWPGGVVAGKKVVCDRLVRCDR